jgi:hypothetical protein
VAVGDGEGVNVAVGGIGVEVKVGEGTGVRVGAGIEGAQATSNTRRKMQNEERGMSVSLEK